MASAGQRPFCPALFVKNWHLSTLGHFGGRSCSRRLSPISNARRAPQAKLPISPLVGEMSGRTEGREGSLQNCSAQLCGSSSRTAKQPIYF
ncbi:MAG: hypothetical protein E5W87_01135 [Mesorhizobium sp.]|nr:MAG: hypothetical protein E5W87_01135 [Mesorhizobium sp.]